MKRSIIDTINRLEKQLSQVHFIVNSIEHKRATSSKTLRDWLIETEELLQKLRITEASKFATKRGELSAFIPKDLRNKKREQLQFCASLLTQSQEDLWNLYEGFQIKLENAKSLITQLLGVVYQTNQFKYNPSENFTLFLERIWSFCKQHPQLNGITMQITNLINKTDVLIIIGEEIDIESI
ncbi:hypothetical protein [Tenacibaculum sp. M341]|uniref:hypothetical protein n=1 Tax=Tenacibaculum sp. M341 TaxID=2530339 RepID=UPI0010535E70|nr:hypothetical protein [Tenacibaculum sp. M341]TCI92287.1 hypothetical protein EYW44_08890 [Tenacibaculum sp. M341]